MLFFDTYAIIELLEGNPNYKQFLRERVVTSVMNIGEFYWTVIREKGREQADMVLEKLQPELLDIDRETMIEAMQFRFEHRKQKMSMIDCIGYILAKKHRLKFLTGDKEFENVENVEFVK
jgi:uncharacterized protein